MSKRNRKERSASADAIIALLVERFPRCFAIYEVRRRPLKIGIDHDIAVALGNAFEGRELNHALGYYTGAPGYLQRLRIGAWRYGLNGEVHGAVTLLEQEHAKAALAKQAAGKAARAAQEQSERQAQERNERQRQMAVNAAKGPNGGRPRLTLKLIKDRGHEKRSLG